MIHNILMFIISAFKEKILHSLCVFIKGRTGQEMFYRILTIVLCLVVSIMYYTISGYTYIRQKSANDVIAQSIQDKINMSLIKKALECGSGYYVGWIYINDEYGIVKNVYSSNTDGSFIDIKYTQCLISSNDNSNIKSFCLPRKIDKKTKDFLNSRVEGEPFYITKKDAIDHEYELLSDLIRDSITGIEDVVAVAIKNDSKTIWIFYVTWKPNAVSEICSQADIRQELRDLSLNAKSSVFTQNFII
jgi:hypothetical protein